jgi:hypothetical protein
MAHFFPIDNKEKEGWGKSRILKCFPLPRFENRQSICQERNFLVTTYFFNGFYDQALFLESKMVKVFRQKFGV